MNPPVSRLLLVVFIATASSVRADESAKFLTLRETIESRRAAKTRLTVELEDGSIMSGMVGRTKRASFYMLEGTPPLSHNVAYTDVRVLVDPATGERLEVQVPGPGAKMPRARFSLKAWLIAGVVIGVVVIWIFASGLNRA